MDQYIRIQNLYEREVSYVFPFVVFLTFRLRDWFDFSLLS